jgi:hypothetical protein
VSEESDRLCFFFFFSTFGASEDMAGVRDRQSFCCGLKSCRETSAKEWWRRSLQVIDASKPEK